MSFVSWQYLGFLALIVLIYWQIPLRGRLTLLLAGSYFFYGVWDARFLALLMTSTTLDFFCGLGIVGKSRPLLMVVGTATCPFLSLLLCRVFSTEVQKPVDFWILGLALGFPLFLALFYRFLFHMKEVDRRKGFLLLSILSNLAVLVFFKYFNFFAASLEGLGTQMGFSFGWTLPHVILPVGISFYTFQSIAYSVDVYRGKAQPSEDLLTFASYLSFFPQLVAGPIERAKDLLPQFEVPMKWDVTHLHQGCRLILVGFFKKVFVADNMAALANYAFDNSTSLNRGWAVLGVLAFAFQIYGDFSGYTDIARGSAQLLGIRLKMNFRFPYFARGPSDFWRRWHITLSEWFRDYVYIPLGGNRCSNRRMIINLWVTMLLAGLWHGASWTFVLWGAFHGFLLWLYRAVPSLRILEEENKSSAWKTCTAIFVMFAFTLIGWAIFRSNNLHQLNDWFSALAHGGAGPGFPWQKGVVWILIHILPLLGLQAATWKQRDEAEMGHLHWGVRSVLYLVMWLGICTTVSMNYEFIYFQF